MNEVVPIGTVARRGAAAVGGIVGSILLAVLGALPGFLGLAAGAVVGIIGLGVLASKDPSAKFPGLVCLGAGVLTILSRLPFLGGIAKWLLGFGVLALLVMGIWNSIKFILGMKSRA